MHKATLYKHDLQGRKCQDTPLAYAQVTDDAVVEVRMQDGTVLVSMSLEQVGYFLMWDLYPITASPFMGGRPVRSCPR